MKRTAAVLAVAALALAACGNGNGNGDDDTGAAPANGEAGQVEVTVSAVDIDFEPDSIDIASGSTLVVTVENDGNLEHDFQLEDGSGTEVLAAGESETVELGPFTSSTVAFCTVPGHREAGMEFDINVE